MIRAPSLAVLLFALAGFPAAAVIAPQTVLADSVNSLNLRATYDVDAHFNWGDRAVAVSTLVHLSNPTANGVSVVAFNLAPLRIGQAHLGTVSVDGAPVNATVDDQTVLVPASIASGGGADVTINYTARLQTRTDGDYWQFIRKAGVMTAYRWIPWLSRTVRFDRPSVGEPWVTPSSSSVQVSITTDRPLIFATSGRRTGVSVDGLTQTFVATNVRDFNFSASPNYRTATRSVRGTTITFYYRRMAPDAVLDWTVAAFNDYSNKIGEYPYPQLNVAEVGPWAGIESPSLFWVPYNTQRRLLPWTVTHEVAHQWFYSVVGNDQALQPFADEALADFMSRSLINSFVPSLCAQDDLDQSIYDLGRCYPWVIYVQGDAYLKAYKERVGDAAFWRGLANYYAANKFGIGGTREILNALDAAAGISYPHQERFPTLY